MLFRQGCTKTYIRLYHTKFDPIHQIGLIKGNIIHLGRWKK